MGAIPFHADELAAQQRAGFGTSGSGIRDFMLEQHRDFFAALPHVFISGIDSAGWPIAALLEGDPGFVASPDPVTLRIRALPASDDPAAATIRVGREIGILGIDFATRRRNRANGVISDVDATTFTVAIKQSFGNCPQYIQRRTLHHADLLRGDARKLDSLDDIARALIQRSDTFFAASRSRVEAGDTGGADISHRGGRPGFVRVQGDTLSIPDFRGNRYLNTLGNLLGEPRSSLLFLDFETGDLLQLQGLASIDWNPSESDRIQGAERIWHFRVMQGWYRPHAAAIRGTFIDYSPVTLRTGTWAVAPR
jgi:predicted pyridoxine 5'-phosphate oxidase superfamily flavin-nucleotide-binding protein